MNVILIIIDTLRRDHLGCYGNSSIQTPNFDRLSAMGVTFENAYLGSYPCMPARRDIWTGRYEFPWRGWGPLEYDDLDLIQMIRDQHTTMLITDHYHLFERGSGNYHFHFEGWEFIRGQENDKWITDPTIEVKFPAPESTKVNRGWRQYYRNRAHWRTERDTFAAQTFQAAMDWLDRNHTLEDFFLMIDCFDPHEPFDPPHPFDVMYAPEPPETRIRWPIYGPANRYTEEELQDIRALYAGELTLVDTWLGHFLDKLGRLGLFGDSMILLTTDHGYLFGEHGMIGKPSTYHRDSNMYQEIAHIPLILYHPEFRNAGRRPKTLVQHVDLYPTVLEVMGTPLPEGLQGKSLFAAIGDEKVVIREYACYSKFGEAINATDGRYTLFQWPPTDQNKPLYWYSSLPPQFLIPKDVGKYESSNQRFPIEYHRGKSESALYDLRSDYAQKENLIGQEVEVRNRMCQGILDFLEERRAPEEIKERLGLA